MDIPVYVFTGFLDSGKTRFIQGTLEDERFNAGERTLVVLCEEGEEELNIEKMPNKNVVIKTLEDEEDLTPENLAAMRRESRAERVMIEYNGMWPITSLYNNMPKSWVIYQQMMFANANDILAYNANMRNIVADKIQNCEVIIFNRFGDNQDKMPLHKLVRALSRRADIAYEHNDEQVEYDDIEDPLPFDINADIIEVEDRDYALFYRDLMEELEKYNGKTVKFKGCCANDRKLPDDTLISGRHVMTCCSADIQYAGIIVKSDDAKDIKTNDWAVITAKVKIEYHKAYKEDGPVLYAVDIKKCPPPEEKVATFY